MAEPRNRASFSEEAAKSRSFEVGDYLIEMIAPDGARSYELVRVDDHTEKFEAVMSRAPAKMLTEETAQVALMTWRSVPAAPGYPVAAYARTLDHLGREVMDGPALEAWLNAHAEELGIGD